MIPLIDTHQHVIYRDKLSYSWTKDVKVLASENFTIEKYNNLTKDLGVAGTIFMETAVDDKYYQEEASFVKNLLNNSDNKMLGMISAIQPENNIGFEAWLDESSEMGSVGYRRNLFDQPDSLSQTDIFRKNIRKIGNLGKTFDICYLPQQLKIALDLAESCDNTMMILDHCGIPNIADNEIDSWKKGLEALSKASNVICKLSGLMAYCAPGKSSYESIKPYVDYVLNCFGPYRIVWGGDWPVVDLGKGLPEWIHVTRQILDPLSNEEATAIANGTAQSVYKVSL
jgi:predicted TIM-barrel fold metal-dependent hydrolase